MNWTTTLDGNGDVIITADTAEGAYTMRRPAGAPRGQWALTRDGYPLAAGTLAVCRKAAEENREWRAIERLRAAMPGERGVITTSRLLSPEEALAAMDAIERRAE